VIEEAADRGVGVVVKKALGSGTLDPAEALRFVLRQRGVTAAVVGTLKLDHLRSNLTAAEGTAEAEGEA
jgi:aryl-alcohol dehydrogenase-like predicted oxidoreductase